MGDRPASYPQQRRNAKIYPISRAMSQTSESAVTKVLQPVGCCLGCAGLLVGIPIFLAIAVYGIIFHTSLPLRLVLNLAETDATMKFRGVHGSITKGFTIKEWVIKGQNGVEDSRVENLTFRYNGVMDAVQHQRLIIDEISVAKADFVLGPDFFTPSDSTAEEAPSTPEEDTGENPDDAATDENSDSAPPSGETVELDFEFQLKTLNLQNMRIRSSDGQFELAIPQVTLDTMQFKDQAFSLKSLDINDFQLRLPNVGPALTAENLDAVDLAIPQIHLAGLGITGDRFDLAELDVTSNVVSFSLAEAQPQTINGEVIPYSRRIRGQIAPTVNEVILRPFDFTLDFATINDGKTPPQEYRIIHRFVGFGGAVEQVTFPSGGAFIRTKTFSPADYFALQSELVPERCSLLSISKPDPANSSSDPNPASTIQGDCYWGATQFTLSPQSDETLVATAQVQDHGITLRMQSNDQTWVPMMEVTAEPPLPVPNILALVYFGQAYDQLNEGERSRINAMEAELQGLMPVPE
ncbi:MAG: hypothetical protein VKJ64_21495 [Leptolyngbyaceae bacterium]|nr:hypothetical protein [Leptolyngbyaceae bacterium]